MSSHVGEVLREARKRLTISQDALGAELGVSSYFIGDVERGSRLLPVLRMAKAEAFLSLERGALMRAACRDGRPLLLPVGFGERVDDAACSVAVAWMDDGTREAAAEKVASALTCEVYALG